MTDPFAVRQLSLERLVALLPSPLHPLHGRRATPLSLPDNVICFRRVSATDLNRPQRGRALHHRFVLILALGTDVTVCVDDRAIRLHEGEGLLVFPFQFHHYTDAARPELDWLFVTFELADAEALLLLRFRPFVITPALRQVAADLLTAYLSPGEADLTALLLALLLARARQAGPARRRNHPPPGAPGLVPQVNQLALRKDEPLSAKEIARALGISVSHLRARFRASCGVSLGRHLRRLRLERACGLLRLSEKRVSEVGEACGFTSIYSFSRAFRAAYGVSPLAYRRGDRAAARPP
ncbi:MAG TPA: AraC family transcriptional regulator [Opitutaceae bacterium]|nr:AraC family transcriptional regulator [Opitutaceae bacterium]